VWCVCKREREKGKKREKEGERGRKRKKEEERGRKRGREREREGEKERETERARDPLSRVRCLTLDHARVSTHVATDRARASKSNASASDTPGLSFLPTFLLARTRRSWLVLPALCPSFSSSFSFSFYLRAFPMPVPRDLSFTPSLSTGHALVHHLSFSLHESLSLFLLSLDLSRQHVSSTSLLPFVSPSARYGHPRPIFSDLFQFALTSSSFSFYSSAVSSFTSL